MDDDDIDIDRFIDEPDIIAEIWDFSESPSGKVTKRVRATGGDPNASSVVTLDIRDGRFDAEVVNVTYDPRTGNGRPPRITAEDFPSWRTSVRNQDVCWDHHDRGPNPLSRLCGLLLRSNQTWLP